MGGHASGPLYSDGPEYLGADLHVSGSLNFLHSTNQKTAFLAGSGTASTLTLTGMAATDTVLAATRVWIKSVSAAPTISNLTSVAVAGANTITFTGHTTGTSLVVVTWLDVSAVSTG